MTKLLGYCPIPNSTAYNVYVSFSSTKEGLVGEQTACIWTREQTFDTQIAGLNIGDVVPLDVRFQKFELNDPKTFEWKAVWSI